MPPYQVVIKRVVSPDGKTISEARSVVMVSGDNQTEITQRISVEVSADNSSSSSSSKSSAGSLAK